MVTDGTGAAKTNPAMPDLGLLVRRTMLRTEPVLGPFWHGSYALVIRAAAAGRAARPRARRLRGGGVRPGRARPGAFDVDLAVVVPDGGPRGPP